VIEFYYAPTPNGWKVAIMLEECKLAYKTKLLNIETGDQFQESFMLINPNAKIPAIVDHNPPLPFKRKTVSVFESGAILLYLAEKTEKFLGHDHDSRKEMFEWLFWQTSNQGPMAGQLSHFVNYAPVDEKNYSFIRYKGEYERNLAILERRLSTRTYILRNYSICDMIIFPWVFISKSLKVSLDEFPHVFAWRNKIKQRLAVIKAINLFKSKQIESKNDPKKIVYYLIKTPHIFLKTITEKLSTSLFFYKSILIERSSNL